MLRKGKLYYWQTASTHAHCHQCRGCSVHWSLSADTVVTATYSSPFLYKTVASRCLKKLALDKKHLMQQQEQLPKLPVVSANCPTTAGRTEAKAFYGFFFSSPCFLSGSSGIISPFITALKTLI